MNEWIEDGRGEGGKWINFMYCAEAHPVEYAKATCFNCSVLDQKKVEI